MKIPAPNSLFIHSIFFMFSISFKKLMYPLFQLISSYQKLKFLSILIVQSSKPEASSIFLLKSLFFFLSIKFSYLREDKNSAQLALISMKISLACSRSSLYSILLPFSAPIIPIHKIIYFKLSWLQLQQIMNKVKLWLDCDPGHDDMLAIILAAHTDSLDLIGISTSAGNSVIENTTQNALNILYEIGRQDIEVVRGDSHPLCGILATAAEIHGKSGLEGAELQQSPNTAVVNKPFLHIYNKIMEQQGLVEFVVTGAMTNLAILLKAFPDIKHKIKGITIMGGAIGLGNWSPAAEFNILVDPEAAAIVFAAGLPLVMVPLEVTHTTLITEDIFQQLNSLQSSFCRKLPPLFRYFQKCYKQTQDFDFPVAHDPCTIYYLLHPQDFKIKKAYVQIQLQGKSRGRTNCDFMHQRPNTTVCVSINVNNFWKTMMACLRKIK